MWHYMWWNIGIIENIVQFLRLLSFSLEKKGQSNSSRLHHIIIKIWSVKIIVSNGKSFFNHTIQHVDEHVDKWAYIKYVEKAPRILSKIVPLFVFFSNNFLSFAHQNENDDEMKIFFSILLFNNTHTILNICMVTSRKTNVYSRVECF
jgi:hypothetical protein